MNWEAFAQLMQARRNAHLVLKYRKAEPGIIQVARMAIMCRGMGYEAFYQLRDKYANVSTELLERSLSDMDKEIEHRLDSYFLADMV